MTSDLPFSFESTNSELEIARTHVRHGRLAEAERIYRHVAAENVDHAEALRFLANAALARGDPGEAVALLSRVANVNRNDAGVLLELGVAYRSGQRLDEARSVFERVLESDRGSNSTARLLLANVFELDDRPELALLHYFRAILDAQEKGQWLSDDTTEASLRQFVKHAMQYVATGRRGLFERVLEPYRRGINATRLGRIDAALATYLRERAETPADPRQKPTFLYIPGLGASCYFDIASFDWLADWCHGASSLDDEALACLGSITEVPDLSPFSLESMTTNQGANAAAGREQRAPLYQRGLSQNATRSQAPQLFRMLESAPLVHIPNYAPDAAILALQPGIHTTRRPGRTNAFCTIVVAFSGSAPLRVTVGGGGRVLQATEALALDPSFGCDYAAAGDRQARALVFEVWHPDFSSMERDALTALTSAALDFDGRLQDLA